MYQVTLAFSIPAFNWNVFCCEIIAKGPVRTDDMCVLNIFDYSSLLFVFLFTPNAGLFFSFDSYFALFIAILSLFSSWQNDTSPYNVHAVDAMCPADPSWTKKLTPTAEGSQWLLMAHNSVPPKELSSAEGSCLAQGYTPPRRQPASKKAQTLALDRSLSWLE